MTQMMHEIYSLCSINMITSMFYENNIACTAQFKQWHIKGDRTSYILAKYIIARYLQQSGETYVNKDIYVIISDTSLQSHYQLKFFKIFIISNIIVYIREINTYILHTFFLHHILSRWIFLVKFLMNQFSQKLCCTFFLPFVMCFS